MRKLALTLVLGIIIFAGCSVTKEEHKLHQAHFDAYLTDKAIEKNIERLELNKELTAEYLSSSGAGGSNYWTTRFLKNGSRYFKESNYTPYMGFKCSIKTPCDNHKNFTEITKEEFYDEVLGVHTIKAKRDMFEESHTENDSSVCFSYFPFNICLTSKGIFKNLYSGSGNQHTSYELKELKNYAECFSFSKCIDNKNKKTIDPSCEEKIEICDTLCIDGDCVAEDDYFTFAFLEKNISLCEKINDTYLKEECYLFPDLDLNLSFCHSLQDESFRTDCYAKEVNRINISEIKRSDCEEITDFTYKTECEEKFYIKQATDTGDLSVCDRIKEYLGLRNDCYIRVALKTGNSSICEELEDYNKRLCYSNLQQ